ncbi:putative golgi integral membrane protein [Botrytis fragariae]|uniref:Protein BTN n=1 Tax=Botrytis fragariae TaxID=1964551 RepID=A0A8H6ALT2_9HELO|nr:putative golgi integral membrane protein [Botrytis fragariae]KAF5869719.1 putative golgi integral membrane protein [Botrytis fragariae]
MNRSSSSTGLSLPLPGSPGSSWAMYRARLAAIFHGADTSVLIAFWLFGLINNVLYVIILSAALDLVGPDIPKSVVLLADVLPSFVTKLVAPYFIHKIPYWIRIIVFCSLSSGGMLLIALTPDDKSVSTKLFGVILASLSSGCGELSFLGLTHYYGHFSLAAWGSGTGGAGLAGAGLYVLLTTIIGLSVKISLLASAFLPCIMLLSFFVILPQGPLRRASLRKDYNTLPGEDSLNQPLTTSDIDDLPPDSAAASLLAPGPAIASEAYSSHSPGVSPTLLYPTPSSGNPFSHYRSFYPTYGFIYQLGVFISRSSTPFYRIHNLYIPSFLQIANLFLLISQALWFWIPSVYIIFVVIFWEGLLGGAVYVNTFAEIMEKVGEADREFSLGATSVSDSGGICIAGFVGMVLEVGLCEWQVERGRGWCRMT